jgi:hypothetical protein
MWSSGGGRRRSTENPANSPVFAAEKGRGKGPRSPRVRFRGSAGSGKGPARGLDGARWRWAPRAVPRCGRCSDWAMCGTSGCSKGSRLGLCVSLGRGWLGMGSSSWRRPWRTMALREMEERRRRAQGRSAALNRRLSLASWRRDWRKFWLWYCWRKKCTQRQSHSKPNKAGFTRAESKWHASQFFLKINKR